jgi:hypothetical protein
MKISVIPEGREGCYLADVTSLKAWIEQENFDRIHNFIAAGPVIIGADHEVDSVIKDIDNALTVAILTGEAKRGNHNHALALILPEGQTGRLEMYDIGDITEDDLDIGSSV